jgi:hypothetical protein
MHYGTSQLLFVTKENNSVLKAVTLNVEDA